MNAGDLDREIYLQRAVKTTNAETGEEVIAYPTSERVWAQWLPGTTREGYLAAQRLEGTIDGVFRIYFRDDIAADTHRVVWNGRVFDLKPPAEIGYREGLELPVVARAEQ